MKLTGNQKLVMVKLMNKLMPIIRKSTPKKIGDKFVYSASTTIKNDMDFYKLYLELRKEAMANSGLFKSKEFDKFEEVIVNKSHPAHKEMCKSFEFMVGQDINSDRRFPCEITLKTMSSLEKYRRIKYLEEVLGQLKHTVSREQSFEMRQELEDLQEVEAQDVVVTLNFAVASLVPQRRSASETIKTLQQRVSRLEKQSSSSDIPAQVRNQMLDILDENDAEFEKAESKSNGLTMISYIIVTLEDYKKYYFIVSDQKLVVYFNNEQDADKAYSALTK